MRDIKLYFKGLLSFYRDLMLLIEIDHERANIKELYFNSIKFNKWILLNKYYKV